ncbi:MAG: MBL fold metallo-hydrolase [Proteobacteria bacterium]|nr:MBL fold metallo-hydrolase [Pseudomonadota bacterium]
MTDSRLSTILGNSQHLDGGAMFGNVPRAVWEQWIKPDNVGRIALECRAMLLELNGLRILCETGIGAFFDPKLASRFGVSETSHKLIENLNKIGVDESDIDFVILSHLHFDHAGGLLPSWSESQGPAKRLLFPKAKYVVGKEAFARSESPHPRDRASFIPELQGLLKASGRLRIVDGPTLPELLPEQIRFFLTHGHTPGQMHTVVTGASETVIFAGDTIPGRAWVHLPVTMGYDRFAEQVINEKQALYDEIADKPHTWLFYTHDHEVALSKISFSAAKKYLATSERASPIHWDF